MSLDLETIRVRLSRADVPTIIADAFALISEVDRLRAEVAFLRASFFPYHPSDYGHEAWTEEARRAGASELAAERAAVVAYLLAGTCDCRECMDEAVVRLAREIERGEHRRDK